jgi:hypothetical protein
MQHAQLAWLFQDWPGNPWPGASADYATVSNKLETNWSSEIVKNGQNRSVLEENGNKKIIKRKWKLLKEGWNDTVFTEK